jgi:hypothetical protein
MGLRSGLDAVEKRHCKKRSRRMRKKRKMKEMRERAVDDKLSGRR